MNTDRLRYFAAVVETKNLRQASELVGIAPASMSKAISTLESEFGIELIRPDGRGIQVTEKGLEIYRQSLQLLTEVTNLERTLKSAVNSCSQLKIATFEIFSTYLMAKLLSVPELSDMDAMVLERSPGTLEEVILEGLCDFGITYLPKPHSKLQYTEIGSFKMGIFGNFKWNAANFQTWPFAVPVTEVKVHTLADSSLDLWPTHSLQRKIKYRFELLETALQLSRHGRAVLHCPDFIVKLHNCDLRNSLQLSPLPKPAGYPKQSAKKIFLITKKSSGTTKIHYQLPKLFRSIM